MMPFSYDTVNYYSIFPFQCLTFLTLSFCRAVHRAPLFCGMAYRTKVYSFPLYGMRFCHVCPCISFRGNVKIYLLFFCGGKRLIIFRFVLYFFRFRVGLEYHGHTKTGLSQKIFPNQLRQPRMLPYCQCNPLHLLKRFLAAGGQATCPPKRTAHLQSMHTKPDGSACRRCISAKGAHRSPFL